MATIHDINLDVEKEDIEELLEINDRELTADELIEFFHQQCEKSEMRISYKIKDAEKNYDC